MLNNSETLCRPSAILRGTEHVSALTCALLYCCSLSIIFLLASGFCQWRSQARADRVLTLNMNIRLPLAKSRARGQDSATCAGLAHGTR